MENEMNIEETISATDIIQDQDFMAGIPANEREAMGLQIREAVCMMNDKCLCCLLTCNEEEWPVTDGVDEWEYEAAVAAWQEFLATGVSGTDWFRGEYNSID